MRKKIIKSFGSFALSHFLYFVTITILLRQTFVSLFCLFVCLFVFRQNLRDRGASKDAGTFVGSREFRY